MNLFLLQCVLRCLILFGLVTSGFADQGPVIIQVASYKNSVLSQIDLPLTQEIARHSAVLQRAISATQSREPIFLGHTLQIDSAKAIFRSLQILVDLRSSNPIRYINIAGKFIFIRTFPKLLDVPFGQDQGAMALKDIKLPDLVRMLFDVEYLQIVPEEHALILQESLCHLIAKRLISSASNSLDSLLEMDPDLSKTTGRVFPAVILEKIYEHIRVLKLGLEPVNMADYFSIHPVKVHVYRDRDFVADKIEICGKGITSLEGLDAFPYAKSISTIDLRRLPVARIQKGLFSNFKNLTSLYLTDLLITELENNTFLGLKQLKTLSMVNNEKLHTIAVDVFSPLVSLEKFDFYFNPSVWEQDSSGANQDTFKEKYKISARIVVNLKPPVEDFDYLVPSGMPGI